MVSVRRLTWPMLRHVRWRDSIWRWLARLPCSLQEHSSGFPGLRVRLFDRFVSKDIPADT